jgi:ABC-type branched-subunit amino acid transport system permease subunit
LDLSSISVRGAGVGTVHFDVSFSLMLPIAAMVAAFIGLLYGVPTLRLKGDADQAALRQFSR